MAWDKRADEILGNDTTDILQKNDISVSSCEQNENGIEAELEFYSDAGEDFLMTINCETAEDFASAFREYAENFDPDEHAQMWAGGRGAPSLTELVEDAHSIKQFLEDVATVLEGDTVQRDVTVEITLSQEELDKLVGTGKLEVGGRTDPEMIADAIQQMIAELDAPEQERDFTALEAAIKELISDLTYGSSMSEEISPSSYDDRISSEMMMSWFETYQEFVQNGVDDYGSFANYVNDQMWNMFVDNGAVFEVEDNLIQQIRDRLPDELLDDFYAYMDDKSPSEALEACGFEGVTIDTEGYIDKNYHINLMFTTEQEQNYDMGSIVDTFPDIAGILDGHYSSTYLESEDFAKYMDNALTYLIHQQGHTLSEVYAAMYADYPTAEVSDEALTETKGGDNFVTSVVSEINEAPQYSMYELTALTSASGKELLEVLDNIAHGRGYISLSKETEIGLYNEWQGTGSSLEVNLEQPAVFPTSMVRNVQFEATDSRDYVQKRVGEHSVDSVYGLIGSAWEQGSVSVTTEAPALQEENMKDTQAQMVGYKEKEQRERDKGKNIER